MQATGPLVSQQIQQAYRAAQAALQQARAEAAEMGHAIQELSGDREHTFEELARHYLPDLSRESLVKTWSEARRSIEQILLRKERELTKLDEKLDECDAFQSKAESLLTERTKALDQHLERQQQVSEQLSKLLSSNQQFIDLTQRAAEAEAALERAESSLEQVEHDANQKLPAYENSKLFMYLYGRRLATPKYTARGFSRRMDRWVGRLIDYPKAKLGYEYLKSTPAQVRILVSQDKDALKVVMSELERQRDEQAEKLGLPAIVAQVDKADHARHDVLDELATIHQETDETRNRRSLIDSPEGPFYKEAIEYFKDLLEKTARETLDDRARRTPDPRDDQIVARLQHLDGRARQVNTEASARQQRIAWLDKHLADISTLHQRFRAERFDSSQSIFDGSIHLSEELNRVREGHDSIDSVWQRLRARHRFAPSVFETAGTGLANVARHPLTQVLVHAMAHAATQSMTGHARRAGSRYGDRGGSGGQSYGPVRTSRPSGGSSGSSSGGFQTRRKI